MHTRYTVGSLFWAEYIISFSISTDTNSCSPHDDLLVLAQSEMSCRRFCDLLLPSASRGHTMRTPYSYPEGRLVYHESRGILHWVLSCRLSAKAARTCPWIHLPVVPPASHPACIVVLQKTARSPGAIHGSVDQWGTQDFFRRGINWKARRVGN